MIQPICSPRETTALEWFFVVEPHKEEVWPLEEKLHATPEKMRKPLPIAELTAQLDAFSARLAAIKEPTLLLEEGYGARLYTGPM